MRDSLIKAYIQLALACIARQITFDEFQSVTTPLIAIMSSDEIAAARYQVEAVRTTTRSDK